MMLVDWRVQPFAEGWEDVEPDAVVWVDVAKVDGSISLDRSRYVGSGGSGVGQPARYANIGRHILSGWPIWMPYLTLGEYEQVRFTDGRHRFAWIRDHGAVALPVATDPACAERLTSRFGSSLRACRITPP